MAGPILAVAGPILAVAGPIPYFRFPANPGPRGTTSCNAPPHARWDCPRSACARLHRFGHTCAVSHGFYAHRLCQSCLESCSLAGYARYRDSIKHRFSMAELEVDEGDTLLALGRCEVSTGILG